MSNLLLRFKTFLPKDQFPRSVTILTGGTVLSQGLMILTSPILTRLYSPDDFGVLAVYTSILSILAVVASLRYELAIPLAKDIDSAANLLALSLLVVLVTSLLTCVGVWLLSDSIVIWSGSPSLKPYLWLLPVSLFGAGAYQALNYWTSRCKNFKLLSYTKGLQTSGQVSIQIVGGLLNLGSAGLVVGYLSSHILGVISLIKRWDCFHIVNPTRFLTLAKEYKNFPLFTTWASIINVVGLQIPPVLFVKYFNLDVAGFFSLTMRMLALPAALVGQAVAQVFYPTVADNQDDVSTRRLIEKMATSLLIPALAIFAFITLHGSFIFKLVFGDDWKDAGRYAQYLAPWFIFSFISSPLSTFALVKGRQKRVFWITFYETGLRLGMIGLGAWYASPDLAVGLFSAAGTLISLVYIAWVLRLAGSSFKLWFISIKRYVLVGMLLMFSLFSVNFMLDPLISLAISASSLGVFSLWFWRKTCKEVYDDRVA